MKTETRGNWGKLAPVMMAVGAGIGVVVGVIVEGGSGIAMGLVFGAGLGLLISMLASPQQPGPRH